MSSRRKKTRTQGKGRWCWRRHAAYPRARRRLQRVEHGGLVGLGQLILDGDRRGRPAAVADAAAVAAAEAAQNAAAAVAALEESLSQVRQWGEAETMNIFNIIILFPKKNFSNIFEGIC